MAARSFLAVALRREYICLWLWLLAVACVNLVPRQGWNPSHGPVVPHDTFPADCSLCHDGSDWNKVRTDFVYDHERETGYPLVGAHATASCLMCHNDRGPVRQFAARGCAGCHDDVHRARLGSSCEVCHDEQTWLPRQQISQHDTTRFPLVGAHAAAACFRCHPGAQVGNFSGAPIECAVCHAQDYAGTTSPNHALQGYAQSCEQCHLETGWQPARFDHPTTFPLERGHFGLECASCHTTPGAFVGLTTDCSSCHSDAHQAADNPNHAAAGFGLDCQQCHDTRRWSASTWMHPGDLELTFAHAGRRCADCHQGQSFAGTSSDCVACHIRDFEATTSPNHTTSGFGQDCHSCHNTAIWQGATFEHPAAFPLDNAHQQACAACHTTAGIYQGLDPSCVACHLPNFQATVDPPHVSFQIGQQCEQCHTVTTWPSAPGWTHAFPITAGDHAGMSCFDCHNNAGNRPAFSCIDCHEHNQGDMADEHDDVPGYVWVSASCYACHPTGEK